MLIGPENQAAIETFANAVGEEVARAIQPHVDEVIQQTNLIFDIADFELAGLINEIPSLTQDNSDKIEFLTETRLGLVDSKKIRECEKTFTDGFYELQKLGYSLTEEMPAEQVESTSKTMVSLIGRLDLLTRVLGGRPVTGARHACFYFTGSEGEPEKAHRNYFSNFPFEGAVVGVKAVRYPGKEEERGAFACMVIDPLHDSPIEYVKQEGERINQEYPDSSLTIRERTWIPIGGVQFLFNYVPGQSVEAEIAA